jgi:hypothetical protein
MEPADRRTHVAKSPARWTTRRVPAASVPMTSRTSTCSSSRGATATTRRSSPPCGESSRHGQSVGIRRSAAALSLVAGRIGGRSICYSSGKSIATRSCSTAVRPRDRRSCSSGHAQGVASVRMLVDASHAAVAVSTAYLRDALRRARPSANAIGTRLARGDMGAVSRGARPHRASSMPNSRRRRSAHGRGGRAATTPPNRLSSPRAGRSSRRPSVSSPRSRV